MKKQLSKEMFNKLVGLMVFAGFVGAGIGFYASTFIPQKPVEVVEVCCESEAIEAMTKRMAMLERDVKFLRETIAVVWVHSSKVTLDANDYLQGCED